MKYRVTKEKSSPRITSKLQLENHVICDFELVHLISYFASFCYGFFLFSFQFYHLNILTGRGYELSVPPSCAFGLVIRRSRLCALPSDP